MEEIDYKEECFKKDCKISAAIIAIKMARENHKKKCEEDEKKQFNNPITKMVIKTLNEVKMDDYDTFLKILEDLQYDRDL